MIMEFRNGHFRVYLCTIMQLVRMKKKKSICLDGKVHYVGAHPICSALSQ